MPAESIGGEVNMADPSGRMRHQLWWAHDWRL